jgi:hypothetical protein
MVRSEQRFLYSKNEPCLIRVSKPSSPEKLMPKRRGIHRRHCLVKAAHGGTVLYIL